MAYLGQVESRPDFAAVPDPASQWKSTGRIMEIEGAPKLSYDPDDKHAIPLYPHFKPADLPERPQNKKYVIQQWIGCGSYGSVLLCTAGNSGKRVAIKRQRVNARYESNEARALRQLADGHPNIVKVNEIYYTCSRQHNLYQNIVMEHMPMSLYQYFGQGSGTQPNGITMSRTIAHSFIKQMLNGVGFVHANGLMHRDLKPCNILVDPFSRPQRLKICDFGTTVSIFPYKEHLSFICSRYYRAPELLLGYSRYGLSVDLWAVGAIMMEFVTLHAIFPASPTRNHLDANGCDIFGECEAFQVAMIHNVIGDPSNSDLPVIYNWMYNVPNHMKTRVMTYYFGGAQYGRRVHAVDFVDTLQTVIDVLDLPIISMAKSLLKWNPVERPHCLALLNHPFLKSDFSTLANMWKEYKYGRLPHWKQGIFRDLGILDMMGRLMPDALKIARHSHPHHRLCEMMVRNMPDPDLDIDYNSTPLPMIDYFEHCKELYAFERDLAAERRNIKCQRIDLESESDKEWSDQEMQGNGHGQQSDFDPNASTPPFFSPVRDQANPKRSAAYHLDFNKVHAHHYLYESALREDSQRVSNANSDETMNKIYAELFGKSSKTDDTKEETNQSGHKHFTSRPITAQGRRVQMTVTEDGALSEKIDTSQKPPSTLDAFYTLTQRSTQDSTASLHTALEEPITQDAGEKTSDGALSDASSGASDVTQTEETQREILMQREYLLNLDGYEQVQPVNHGRWGLSASSGASRAWGGILVGRNLA